VEARKDIRLSVPADQLASRLNADGQATSSVSLQNPSLATTPMLKNELAIVGQASYRESEGAPTVPMTCVLAYVLASNRPSQIFYCAANSERALTDAGRLIAAMHKQNPSLDLPRGSLQAIERTTYQHQLKKSGGAANNPTLISGEIEFFAATQNSCQSYGSISQERFVCYEQHAKARLDQLYALNG